MAKPAIYWVEKSVARLRRILTKVLIEGGEAQYDLRAQLETITIERDRMWLAIQWALGESPEGAPDFAKEHAAELDRREQGYLKMNFWWRTTLRNLATAATPPNTPDEKGRLGAILDVAVERGEGCERPPPENKNICPYCRAALTSEGNCPNSMECYSKRPTVSETGKIDVCEGCGYHRCKKTSQYCTGRRI